MLRGLSLCAALVLLAVGRAAADVRDTAEELEVENAELRRGLITRSIPHSDLACRATASPDWPRPATSSVSLLIRWRTTSACQEDYPLSPPPGTVRARVWDAMSPNPVSPI